MTCSKCRLEFSTASRNVRRCSKCQSDYMREWRRKNRDRVVQYEADYRAKNRERYLEWRRAYDKKRRAEDPGYALQRAVRRRIWHAVKGNAKTGSAVRDLGCSVPRLVEHIEGLFSDGMTWSNYGEWHIDHIKPLCSFDLTDRSQFLEACHWTNLRPLWAADNLSRRSEVQDG